MLRNALVINQNGTDTHVFPARIITKTHLTGMVLTVSLAMHKILISQYGQVRIVFPAMSIIRVLRSGILNVKSAIPVKRICHFGTETHVFRVTIITKIRLFGMGTHVYHAMIKILIFQSGIRSTRSVMCAKTKHRIGTESHVFHAMTTIKIHRTGQDQCVYRVMI